MATGDLVADICFFAFFAAEGPWGSTFSKFSLTDVGAVKTHWYALLLSVNIYLAMIRTETYPYKESPLQKPFLGVIGVCPEPGVEECWPGIGGDHEVRMPITNMSTNAVRKTYITRKIATMRSTHVSSLQSYSVGHKSRPVWSPSNPRSAFDSARRATVDSPQRLLTQSTTFPFSLEQSSPRAMSDPCWSLLVGAVSPGAQNCEWKIKNLRSCSTLPAQHDRLGSQRFAPKGQT
jgi:hypothetical protein